MVDLNLTQIITIKLYILYIYRLFDIFNLKPKSETLRVEVNHYKLSGVC